MRVITLNANGLRSSCNKGLMPWLRRQAADFVCLQEIRIQHEQLDLAEHSIRSMTCEYLPAEKAGYSGVALFARKAPRAIHRGIGWADMDFEGRWLEFEYENLTVISVYLPSGSSGDVRQAVKMDLLGRLTLRLAEMRKAGREYVLCGDINIAHKNIDIRNWRGNQKNSGFLPEEREWLDEVFGPLGFVDAFRAVNEEPDQYTWWSNRGNAYANNVGWRIDYQIVTPGLGARATAAQVYKKKKFSDHAPLIMDYDFALDA